MAAGMHDWGLKPYEGACHAWRAGATATEIIQYLSGFSLKADAAGAAAAGTGDHRRDTGKIHICGEAYSDFQGFIEGALRSAALVLTAPPFSLAKSLLRDDREQQILPRTIAISKHEKDIDNQLTTK
jgi:hypothetical protein